MSNAMKDFSAFARKVETATRNLAAVHASDVEIACTPKDLVHKVDKSCLYRYQPVVSGPLSQPVLVIYGLIGRQSMIDLQDNRSLVKNLLALGVDVYEIDWGSPTRADRWLTIDDYINGYIDEYVQQVKQDSGSNRVTLFGICEGGTFSAVYTALYPEKVQNLMLAITPIDFHADIEDGQLDHGFINVWVRNIGEKAIDDLVETNGNMPGEFMSYVFQLMTPMRSLMKYNLDLINVASNEKSLYNFLRMEKWIADRPDHPGEAAKQWFKDYYQHNKLVKGELTVDGVAVDLANITAPVLNIYALQDHIIPPPCSKALGRFVSSDDYEELAVNAGHVGLFVSGKTQPVVAPKIHQWLQQHTTDVGAEGEASWR